MGRDIKTKADKDCRAISQMFLEKFMEGGVYYNFITLVKECSELELCFRGNHYSGENPITGGRVCIYRDNHAVFTITPQTIYINTAYLKYSSDKERSLNILIKKYGFNKGEDILSEEKKYSKYISRNADEIIMKDVKEIYWNVLKEAFDNYLNKGHLEKKRQQELFRIMRKQKNSFYFYDMEYQQRHDNKAKQDEARENDESNKPDMQAIRFGEDGKPEALVFVEVKCTKSAYGGKSGVIEHIKHMRNYPDSYLDSRRREAFLMLHQYQKLGLRDLQRELSWDEYRNLDMKHILIFTDEARTKWEEDKKPEIMEIKNKAENQIIKEIPLEDGRLGLLVCI